MAPTLVKTGFVLTLFSLSSLVSAFVTASTAKLGQYTQFEHLDEIPQGWLHVKHADPETPLVLRLAMKHNPVKATELAQTFFAVSDPLSAIYGKFLEREELTALVTPPAVNLDAVKTWLADYEVKELEVANEWIVFATTVGTAEKLLDTSFNWYKHITAKDGEVHSDQLLLRSLGYSVPSAVAPMINLIQPTTRFGQPNAYKSTLIRQPSLALDSAKALGAAAAPAGCVFNNITADCLRSYYGVDDFEADRSTGGTVAFASFLEEYARYGDLNAYQRNFLPQSTESFEVVKINGGLNEQDSTADSGEANLDVQMIVAMSTPVKVLEYSTGGRGPLIPDLDQPNISMNSNEPYLPFVNYLLSLPNSELPHTLSISYGESEQELPVPYMRTVCNAFMQLGARGVSILASSGDSGPGSACLSNDGKNTLKYLPAFPASCPYITAVGGTYRFEPEQAVPFSGGGFSDTFARPAYQAEAVATYLSMVDYSMSQYYNESSRAYPDVAALGYAAAIYDKGELTQIAGTSMSSPIFAGIVGDLNAARLNKSKKPLGFLNPWLYSLRGDELKDITVGRTTGCTGTSDYSGLPAGFIEDAGFPAVAGWDPATGLGTPNFKPLLQTALAA